MFYSDNSDGNVTNNVTINDTESDKDRIPGFRVTTDAKVYMLLKEDPTQTREVLAKKTGKTIRTIQRALEKLSSEGKIKRLGSNRTG